MQKQKNDVYKIYLDESKKTNRYKNVPYIKKKNLKNKNMFSIVATTTLKKIRKKTATYSLLQYEREQYIVKNRMIGFTKGYIQVTENTLLKLKSNRFLLLILLTFLFLTVSIACSINNKKLTTENVPIENSIIDNSIIEDHVMENNTPRNSIIKKEVKNVILENSVNIQELPNVPLVEKKNTRYNTIVMEDL